MLEEHAAAHLKEDRIRIRQKRITITHCFDRIDWFTHMVYRLALPGYEWNDERPRTVFTAPDVHLVFKLHRRDTLLPKDELYEDDQLVKVNNMYYSMLSWLSDLNAELDFSLFKTISLMEIDRTDGFSQQLRFMHSPNKLYHEDADVAHVDSTAKLHKLLQQEDHRIIANGR